ncbi:MAG: FtsQ-type POTRA domain-containing protein [Pseudomonadota bacterium]|nr:FtsQ-type POTRA domain-containing protein [Pseudomonadota bacterium]
MSGQKIKRGGKSVRRSASAQGKARQVRAARARTGSAIDTVMAIQPFNERQLHRIFLAMILGGAVVLAWMAASFAGVPTMAQEQLAHLAHQAGFELHNVNVRGTKHLNELKVYQIALADRDRAMPFVDLDMVRGRLMALSWVEDARVSRQLPDTLVIDIVERKPVAVLAKPDRFVLIDATGRELENVSEERTKGKLVLSGPGAGQQVAALSGLLDAAPALRPQLKSAEWIGNRRWNLTFKTGQLLALPEGKDESAKSLVTFAQLDGRNRLLGGKAVAFDMRAGDRIYIRMPDRIDPVESAHLAPTPKAATAPTTLPTGNPAKAPKKEVD